MSSGPIIDRVRKVLADNQRISIEQVTGETTFEELGMDSIDATTLLFSLEDEFDISIEDGIAKKFRSVRQVAEGIEKVLSEASKISEPGG